MPRPISNRGITTPYRPEDHGFTEVYRHGGGGVGQTPDVWDNSYFDGSYFHNGKIEAAKGFCTDVFFDQAMRFPVRREPSGPAREMRSEPPTPP